MPTPLDCLILGGGIAGLWTLRALLAEGFDAALVEVEALGSGQTIASQAILHAGTKYALTGHAAAASQAASRAAGIWASCLRGGALRVPDSSARSGASLAADSLDLSPTTILSPHTFMFTTPGVGSRLTGLAASQALASGPTSLSRADYPAAFTDAPAGVDLYALDEPVLDLPSLLDTLAAPTHARLIHARSVTLELSPSRERGVTAHLTTAAGDLSLQPRAVICTAGAGNEQLLAQLGLTAEIPMQRRPLHMVLARASSLPRVYAHCVSLSDKPRATITTATDTVGRTVWYIGGQLAETGVDRTRDEQIAVARAELAKILPWMDIGHAEFATHRVDRAEGFAGHGRRPDTPIVRRQGSVIACWPTKLVLAPLAARAVRAQLAELQIAPSTPPASNPDSPIALSPSASAAPPTATPLWDREDLQWT